MVCPRSQLMTQVQHWATTAQTDNVTLTFDLGGRGAYDWCRSSSSICVRSLSFVGLAVRKIWRTMCVSVNRPGDLDLLTLKLVCQSRQRWGTFIPNVGMVGLRVLGYSLCTRRTDRWTDGLMHKSKAYCSLRYGRGHKKYVGVFETWTTVCVERDFIPFSVETQQ